MRNLIEDQRKKTKNQIKAIKNVLEEMGAVVTEVQNDLYTNLKGMKYQISNPTMFKSLSEPAKFTDWL